MTWEPTPSGGRHSFQPEPEEPIPASLFDPTVTTATYVCPECDAPAPPSTAQTFVRVDSFICFACKATAAFSTIMPRSHFDQLLDTAEQLAMALKQLTEARRALHDVVTFATDVTLSPDELRRAILTLHIP